ncbi:hypothetical protein QJS10_CPB15g00948 [Acorus calamus]|uniref:Ribosomal RNA-processing protein 7 C-terminal domain-containing protein n=1 Tax=Acorus calamus TaxID=4465 RepID=A0AAV9D8N4_ACOCL|nr:hypothetical protein QJS10_CPB15g00948 [Acorus calamus]
MARDREAVKAQKEKKKVSALAPIANPLAVKKLSKKTGKLVRKENKTRNVDRDNEKTTKKKRKEEKGVEVDVDKGDRSDDGRTTNSGCDEMSTHPKVQSEIDKSDVSKEPPIDQNTKLVAEKPNQSGRSKKKNRLKSGKRKKSDESKSGIEVNNADQVMVDGNPDSGLKHRQSKGGKNKRKNRLEYENKVNVKEPKVEMEEEVDEIPMIDEDCSRGMKKWVVEYHRSRPGLAILQERIDDFITAHEAQLEQERKEREERAAEGGWTVVAHHKGRKKTTDAESGITVGSVAQAVVADKLANKKSKEVSLDFYRFQKREAQRNEIMMLQSKFEQDRKRIQQLRAARKFRPY